MLEYINDPNDIKQIQPEDYKLLAKDIRRFSIKKCQSQQGASCIESWNCRTNDGAASCFDFPKDQLILM